MRYLFYEIIIVSLLLLIQASGKCVLPQPDVEDWKYLENSTLQLEEDYRSIIEQTTDRINESTAYLKQTRDDAGGSGLFLYINNFSNEYKINKSIESYKISLAQAEKAIADLSAISTELSKITSRTRAKYLVLRRRIKEWQVQNMTDRSALYDNYSGRRRGYVAPTIENRLEALKANPPESIPIGPRPKGIDMDWQSLPRLDGSTTAQPLLTLMICRMLELSAVWQYRPIYDRSSSGGESPERVLVPQCAGSPIPSDADIYSYYDTASTSFPGLRLNLTMTGTNNAYRNLILGTSDFIIVARPPSASELKLAKDKNVELDSTTIAYDAFIFILNRANSLSDLTVKQIQDIYQDKLLRWSEVGGNDEKIVAFQREQNSGSQETMQEIVMKGLTMAPPVEQLIGQGMGGPYNKLNGEEENGIGYTFYYYHTVQSPVNQSRIKQLDGNKPIPPIKVCAVNGIMPTSETIRNRTYPYVTKVYAIIRKNTTKTNPSVRLRDWLLTPEGQALVKESGYVPLPEENAKE